jgi:TrmH family RNA methyltransferase
VCNNLFGKSTMGEYRINSGNQNSFYMGRAHYCFLVGLLSLAFASDMMICSSAASMGRGCSSKSAFCGSARYQTFLEIQRASARRGDAIYESKWTTTAISPHARRPRTRFPSGDNVSSYFPRHSSNPSHYYSSASDSSRQILTSTKGATVKLFTSLLAKKKARTQHQLTIVEGHRLVLDLLQNASTRHLIKHILVTESALDSADLGLDLQRELDLVMAGDGNAESVKVNFVTDQVMKTCTDTVTPQGVVATCAIPSEWDPKTGNKSTTASASTEDSYGGPHDHSLYLVLDGVSDPGNVGTLLRSSLAVNVKAVLLLPGCVDAYSPKAVRSAMGCTFRVPIQAMDSIDHCWSLLQEECNVTPDRIFAATMDTNASNDDGATITASPAHSDILWANGPSALCIGKEGQGLSTQTREAVLRGDISSLHVPMANRLESLNAAVCGSVILFEYSRQLREYAKIK